MDSVKKYLDLGFANPYSKTVLTLFFVLYGGMVAPRLPGKIRKLFENNIFRVILLFLIVYTGHKDPKFSILIAAGFVISMETLRKFNMQENFENSIKNLEQFAGHSSNDEIVNKKIKFLKDNEMIEADFSIKEGLNEVLNKSFVTEDIKKQVGEFIIELDKTMDENHSIVKDLSPENHKEQTTSLIDKMAVISQSLSEIEKSSHEDDDAETTKAVESIETDIIAPAMQIVNVHSSVHLTE